MQKTILRSRWEKKLALVVTSFVYENWGKGEKEGKVGE
jgi:hypothetical protein